MANTIANQFTGLPIENLIAAPLLAAAEGQKSLASTTAQFITEVGLDASTGETKSVTFNYEDGSEKVVLDVPLLSIINIPSLCVDSIDIEFEMEVSTQTASKLLVGKQVLKVKFLIILKVIEVLIHLQSIVYQLKVNKKNLKV